MLVTVRKEIKKNLRQIHVDLHLEGTFKYFLRVRE